MNKENKFRFLTFKIVNEESVIIDRIGDNTSSINNLIEQLPKDDCRYAIAYVDFTDKDSVPIRKFSKLFFIKWIPADVDIKLRMLYCLGTYSVKNHIMGIHKEIQACTYDELEELTI